jgi:hypothetical protein
VVGGGGGGRKLIINQQHSTHKKTDVPYGKQTEVLKNFLGMRQPSFPEEKNNVLLRSLESFCDIAENFEER